MPAQYTIGGCQVHFPHQAYGVQLSFMSKVIAALEGGHNALLEAPTGSGKTLSLLCSALAWQVREKQRIEEGLAAEKEAARAAQETGAALGEGDPIADPEACCRGGSQGGQCSDGSPEWTGQKPPNNGADPEQQAASPGDGGFMPAGEGGGEPEPPAQRRKPPKIFYATRTHSQIAQVVKELKRSEYKPRMAVLGSRKHYCINMHATRQTSIDEACEELLKESQCQYFKNVHSFVTSGYQYRLHDIEDLKGFGKSHKACPYYTARKWAYEAEVIFAPYSYLIDPVIRRAMSVDVEGSMLIFDEAHNIEDVCREAASVELNMETMVEVLMAFKKAFELNGKPEVYGPLAACAEAVVGWMRDKERVAVQHMQHQQAGGRGGGRGGRGGRGLARFQEPYERLFPAGQLLGELARCGLGPDNMDPLWEAYQAAREEKELMNAGDGGRGKQEGKENQGGEAPAGPPKDTAVRVGAPALGVMSRLIQVVRMLHQVSDDGARDYRLVVQRQYESEPSLTVGRYKSKGRGGEDDGTDTFPPGFVFKTCLWSMNPAVAFKPVADAAHSVVLTSGTLAPLEGFASELGTPFSITLEAPHVVDMRRQVWAGVVGAGPGGTPLVATYKNQCETAFQDAVGRVVLEAAASIPDGLLVFMPSYSLLDRLVTRWKSTGAFKKLEELKKVVQEPRGGGQDALKKTMADYYGAIQSGGGAVFFAVCRGKVSEGLDFADGNARGVIIVGIPFPHAKDLKVNEKKAFNDRGQRALGLVSGDTWYSQQAFRALNQALGRCIRHRLDWGAILMVDDRFKQPRNQKMLSRWVRGVLQVHPSFEAGLASMRGFFQAIEANPPGPPAGAAKKPSEPAEAEMAAAVAAAVAAAGPAPQPVQQPVEVPVGRGAEGALGPWGGTMQQGQPGSLPQRPAGGAGALGVLHVWQGKPLGQARMGQQQQDAAAASRGPHAGSLLPPAVKQEQLGGGGFLPPQPPAHEQWPSGLAQEEQHNQYQQQPAAVKPEPQQWAAGPQQQQQQQGGSNTPMHQSPSQYHPARGWYARPRSVEEAPLGPGAASQLQEVLGEAPIEAWVQADVADCLSFLTEKGLTEEGGLPEGYSTLAAVAVDGVKDAFDAANEFLDLQKPLHHLAVKWGCGLPRGLQAVLAAGPAALPADKPRNAAALAFGEQRLRAGWGPRPLVQGMMAAYKPHLEALRGSPFGSPPQMPSGSEAAQQSAAAEGDGQPSPGWQQRSQQMQQWQQEDGGEGGSPEGSWETAAVAAVPASPDGGHQEQARAPTPPMEWAAQPPPAQPAAQPPQRQRQQQQWQQQADAMPAAHHQQHQPQWHPSAHHWQPQPWQPLPPQPHPHWQPHQQHGLHPAGPGLPPHAGGHPLSGWHQHQHPYGPPLAQQHEWQWGLQPGMGHHPSHGHAWGQPGGPPQQPGMGHPLLQQHQQPWAPPAQPAAAPHPQPAQQLQQPGQGAKRGMPAAPADGAGVAKRRYLRGKNAEAAARSRAAAGGAAGGSAAAALDAAQRAAIAHEVAAAAGEEGSDSDGDFQEARGRR
ncbi:hypothetical protein ABPG75_010969 [Micractinium tetrahymenae]